MNIGLKPFLQVGVYAFLYAVTVVVSPLLVWLGGYLAGITLTGFLAALAANALSMRIFLHRPLLDIGLRWNRASARNLLLGLAGGAGSACLVLAPPILLGAAHFRAESPGEGVATFGFVMVMLAFGAAGEEMCFRGFGFQVLLHRLGPFATILPVGVLFGLLHADNPSVSKLGLANTIGFGILFGCAFLRSRDLWLPIGLHYGWNFVLPVFGVNVSGITMRVTGYALQWSAGPLWSGGDYGPEGSILTSAVFVVLAAYLWKAPIAPNHAPLLEEDATARVEAPHAQSLFSRPDDRRGGGADDDSRSR